MPTIDVNGTTVGYEVRGAPGGGPGLLMIHGTGATAEVNFGHLLEPFADRATVLPDYAGAAAGEQEIGELDMDLLVEQVASAARASGVEGPVDVVGFSLGAVVAATLAARHPELVRRLVLVAGWMRPDPRQRLAFGLWRRLADVDPRTYAEYISLLLFRPAFLASLGEEGLEEAVAGTGFTPAVLRQIDLGADVDISAEVPSITAPTLVIGCTQDQLVPVEHPRAVHEAIPGSEYAEIDSGHLVMFERPEELGAQLVKFLS